MMLVIEECHYVQRKGVGSNGQTRRMCGERLCGELVLIWNVAWPGTLGHQTFDFRVAAFRTLLSGRQKEPIFRLIYTH